MTNFENLFIRIQMFTDCNHLNYVQRLLPKNQIVFMDIDTPSSIFALTLSLAPS